MIHLQVDLGGLTAVGHALDSVAEEVRALQRAWLEEAGDQVARAARAEAPRSPQFLGSLKQRTADRKRGPLRDAIKRGSVGMDGAGNLFIIVAEDDSTKTDWGGGVHYGAMVQGGTKAHIIRPKASNPWGLLFFHSQGGSVLAKAGGGPPGGVPQGLLRIQRPVPKRGKDGRVIRLRGRIQYAKPRDAGRHGRGLTRYAGAGTVVAAREVHHPGTQPNPFFTRAIEAVRPALEARARLMAKRIEQKWASAR